MADYLDIFRPTEANIFFTLTMLSCSEPSAVRQNTIPSRPRLVGSLVDRYTGAMYMMGRLTMVRLLLALPRYYV